MEKETVLLSVVIASLYFIPVLLAHVNQCKNKGVITMIALFGGFTVVGYLAALYLCAKWGNQCERKPIIRS